MGRTNFQKPVSIMVDSIGDTARKASAGTWRKPRVRIYDYNNDLGSNYYQPMIKYINQKDIYGPFMEKKRVEMPDRPEVSSNKYSNMRYDDKADANMDLDDFLVKAYAKQIKELNSSTAMARVTMARAAVSMRPSAHSPLDNVSTKYNPIRLLKGAPPGQDKVNYYASELGISRMHREKQKKRNTWHLFEIEAYNQYDYHHNFFEVGVNRDMKFWNPKLIKTTPKESENL